MFPQEEAPKILQQRSLKIHRKLKSEKRFVILANGPYTYTWQHVYDIFSIKFRSVHMEKKKKKRL